MPEHSVPGNRVLRSKPEKFQETVEVLVPVVWRVLRRCGTPEADIEDGVQQVFMQIAQRWHKLKYSEPRALKGYVCCVASGVSVDLARKRAREQARVVSMQSEVELPDPSHTDLEKHEARHLLEYVLGQLPEERRVVFVLFEIEQLSGPQIAQHLDVPVGTVASRLRLAREEFQRIIARLKARDDFHTKVVS